jgi:hypothetical protein
MNEFWKDIVGFEGLYQVSNLGNVKSLKRNVKYGRLNVVRQERVLKKGKDSDGYCRVVLQKDKQRTYLRVCRLVATTFIPNPQNLPFVNHKDEIKDNDNVLNLEWCTALYNNTYGNRLNIIRNKLHRKVYCGQNGKTYDSESLAAKDLKVSLQTISNALRGVTKNKKEIKYVDERYEKR